MTEQMIGALPVYCADCGLARPRQQAGTSAYHWLRDRADRIAGAR